MLRIWEIFVALIPHLSLAFLSGLLSILLLRVKGSSQKAQLRFLLWYIVGSIASFLIIIIFIPWFFELMSAFLVAPLVVVAGYVLAQRGDYQRLTFIFMILGAIWALISFAPYLLMVGGPAEIPRLWKILTFPAWISGEFEGSVHHFFTSILLKSDPLYVDIFYRHMFWPIVMFVLPFLIGGFIGFLAFRINCYFFLKLRRKTDQSLT
jgi:hypothetical protein